MAASNRSTRLLSLVRFLEEEGIHEALEERYGKTSGTLIDLRP